MLMGTFPAHRPSSPHDQPETRGTQGPRRVTGVWAPGSAPGSPSPPPGRTGAPQGLVGQRSPGQAFESLAAPEHCLTLMPRLLPHQPGSCRRPRAVSRHLWPSDMRRSCLECPCHSHVSLPGATFLGSTATSERPHWPGGNSLRAGLALPLSPCCPAHSRCSVRA